MRRKLVVSCQLSVVSVLLTLAFFSICYAQALSSTELINNAKVYDGKTVLYAGEVIGDVMVRGDHAWINVFDGDNAIGIWLEADLAQDIAYTGSYKAKGDWVEVGGLFHRACAEHGGDLDIHAQFLRKVSPGRAVPEYLNIDKGNLALIGLGVLGAIWILTLLMRR